MSRPADPHRALRRALSQHLGQDGTRFGPSCTRPWASVTFSGARHEFDLYLESGPAMARAMVLHDNARHAEFDLPGHIVADFNVSLSTTAYGQLLHIEALTVETA
ncbi:MAG: hypothetical protein IPN84_06055 [Sphingomonadales bacterium]|jgi:hypothetical protein|nr:hypothetical protein [Sphingomonadales bacterium]